MSKDEDGNIFKEIIGGVLGTIILIVLGAGLLYLIITGLPTIKILFEKLVDLVSKAINLVSHL